MDVATMDLDLSELIPIPQPRSSFPVYSVNVSQRGYVALNQKFLEVLKEKIPSLAVGFRIHPNKQIIAIFQSDHPNYQFPGGGRIKDTAFTQSLVDAGVVLPAREECRSEGWFAYWEARTLYPKYEGCCDFWTYTFFHMKNKLDNLRKTRNKRISEESPFSLNQMVSDANREAIETVLFPIQGDFTSGVMLWDYAYRLGEMKHQIMRKLTLQETDQEIMEALHLNPCEYFRMKQELRQDLQEYLEIS